MGIVARAFLRQNGAVSVGPEGSTLMHASACDRIAEPACIDGVFIRDLSPIPDSRGVLCEVHRDTWGLAPRPVQWDFIASRANVLRGVHVHQRRFDYLIMVEGHATVGLADLRRRSPSFRQSMTINASGEAPCVIIVPPGVAHGIYAQDRLSYLYGLTVAWDGTDEGLGFRYDDPAAGIAWPSRNPEILPRDALLPDLETLISRFETEGGVQAA